MQGWDVGARPWVALHGLSPGESSGRHLLVPADGSAEAFSSAAVAMCQVRPSTRDCIWRCLVVHTDCVGFAILIFLMLSGQDTGI